MDLEQILVNATEFPPRQFTPPTDYRREVLAYPVDGEGLRCDLRLAESLRVSGRAGTRVVSLNTEIGVLRAAITAVVPAASRARAPALNLWSADLHDYARSVRTFRFGAAIFT